MSAHTYKVKLGETLEKLSAAHHAARQWKIVAENRLHLLVGVDTAVSDMIDGLLMIGTLFGVSPTETGLPRAYGTASSGDEVSALVMNKLDSISTFVSHLTKEASSLQLTLMETLALATDATGVEPPTVDLSVSHSSLIRFPPAKPLTDVYDELSNIDDEMESPESTQALDTPSLEVALRTTPSDRSKSIYSL